MVIDRNALEYVFQTSGELQNAAVFDNKPLNLDIDGSMNRTIPKTKSLSKDELKKLKQALMGIITKFIEPFKDEKVGFFLSGGVDSSLLLYLIKQVYKDIDIIAYHTDWKIEERSEVAFAKIMANFVDVPLKIIDTSTEKQIPFVNEALAKCKTISYSMIPVYMAAKAMSEDGVAVGVNALGLDELCAGYTIHKQYFERKKPHIIPYVKTLSRKHVYRAAAIRWGTDKAWFITHVFPFVNTRFVRESAIDVLSLYEREYKANNLWNTIHNLLVDKMISNFANLISRAGRANGFEVIFPYIEPELMDFMFSMAPQAKYNKAPIRHLMRTDFNFPEEIASRGEKWDKIGWGGTPRPYYTDKRYIDALMPEFDRSKEWFTDEVRHYYTTFKNNPTLTGLNMVLFLKILELTE